MSLDVPFAISLFPVILKAFGTTVIVTVLSSALACFFGFSFELMRRQGKIFQYVLRFVIDFIRSTPLLVQLYFFYFVLPIYGIKLPAALIGIWSIGLYYAGYLAEVFKAGLDRVPQGQWEGARSLGLSRFKTIMLVIAPQMVRNVAAPVGSYFISIFKSTPYLAVIAVPDAFGSALDVASDTFRYTEPMIVVGTIFLSTALMMAYFVHRLENKLSLPNVGRNK